MSLTSTATIIVADQTPTTASTSVVILPPSSAPGAVAKGRLIHPTLGTYDYPQAPEETQNVDGGPVYRPIWSHAQTLGGAASALWSGYLRDARVIERWKQGDVGMPAAFARALWAFFTNPPNPADDSFILWTPSYAGTDQQWRVAITDLRIGGDGFNIDWRLMNFASYVPGPIELEMRVLGLED